MQYIALLLAAAGTARAYTEVEVDLFMHKNIDPVVEFGQYKSHLHSFFGSDAVTANTASSKELQTGCTTAHNANDMSSYWVPTLFYVQGTTYTPVPIFRFSAYYVDINAAEVPIPQDYKFLSGNPKAKSQADVNNLAGIEWFCEGDPGQQKDVAEFPLKTCTTHLQTLLLFHDCVNPTTLESTYSGSQNRNGSFKAENGCPKDMKRMPRLRFSIRYDARSVVPGGWDGPAPFELACGPSYCSHGDFMNGWLPEAAQNMVLANSKREFAEVKGPLGGNTGAAVCKAPKDAEPTKGTSDHATSVTMMAKRAPGRYQRNV